MTAALLLSFHCSYTISIRSSSSSSLSSKKMGKTPTAFTFSPQHIHMSNSPDNVHQQLAQLKFYQLQTAFINIHTQDKNSPEYINYKSQLLQQLGTQVYNSVQLKTSDIISIIKDASDHIENNTRNLIEPGMNIAISTYYSTSAEHSSVTPSQQSSPSASHTSYEYSSRSHSRSYHHDCTYLSDDVFDSDDNYKDKEWECESEGEEEEEGDHFRSKAHSWYSDTSIIDYSSSSSPTSTHSLTPQQNNTPFFIA